MDTIVNLFKSAVQETKNGNYQKAIDLYQEIIELSQDNPRDQHIANWGIGEIYLNNKLYDLAERYLSRAVAMAPDEPIYHQI